MVVSEIYRQGPNSIDAILAGVRRFLDANYYRSIESFQQSRSNLDDRRWSLDNGVLIEVAPSRIGRMPNLRVLANVMRRYVVFSCVESGQLQ